MPHLSAHPLDQDDARGRLEGFAEREQRFIDLAQTRSAGLEGLTSVLPNVIADEVIADDDPQRLWSRAVLLAQAASGVFAMQVATPDEPVELVLRDPVVLVARPPGSMAGVSAWIDRAFLPAISTRQHALAGFLARVPAERFARADVRVDAYTYALAETWRSAWLHLSEPLAVASVRRLAEAATAAAAHASVADATQVRGIDLPTLELLTTLVEAAAAPPADRDDLRAAFDATLVRVLEGHQQLWTTAERARKRGGAVCWPAVAACVLARSVGLASEVTSDYVPDALLVGADVEGDGTPAPRFSAGADLLPVDREPAEQAAAIRITADFGVDGATVRWVRPEVDDRARGTGHEGSPDPGWFDQIWQITGSGAPDRYVVAEVLLPGEPLSVRRDPSAGAAYEQGSAPYFDGILAVMRSRSPAEADLADRLAAARAEGRLDYIAVRSEVRDGRITATQVGRFEL